LTHPFDAATAVTAVEPGVYEGTFDRGWWVDVGPNGGYIASIILRALTDSVESDDRQPRSLTVHYVRRPEEGRFEVRTTLERTGRSLTATTARLMQDGDLLATAQAAFSSPRSGDGFSDVPLPDAPAADDIPEIPLPESMIPPIARHFDYRWALGAFPYTGADAAFTGGWIRPKEPRPVDALLLATFADAWPPAVFSRRTTPVGVPTVDLTVHFRGELPPDSAADDWCFVTFRAGVAAGGFIEEDGLIWSSSGELLAQSRQLALYLSDEASR